MANAQVDISFIPNSRGGRHLVYSGYKYRIKTSKGQRVYWKCCHAGCPTTVNTSNDHITSVKDIHNHPRNLNKLSADKFLANLRTTVKTDSRPVSAIYQEELNINQLRSGVPDVVPAVPTLYSVHSSLYRSRAKDIPPLPRQRPNINLPVTYTTTSNNDDFLLYAAQNNKFLIFATEENPRHLAAADVYYCDGTFSMCPSILYQIYTVHAVVSGKMFPLVYALLPDKKQTTYLELFTILKQKASERNINLQPNTVFTDFEVVAQNAIRSVFQCQLKGCLFHFRQALWKNVQSCHLQNAYIDDDRVNLFVIRAFALPLIRLCEIEDFWLHAIENADMDNISVRKFADYVTEQWVEGGERSMWNHFETHGPRTTNHLEGWHSKLAKVSACHPNLYKFIDIIKNEQSNFENTLSQMLAVRPRKKMYRELDDRLEVLKTRLQNGVMTMVEYGDAVSYRYAM